MRSYGKMLGLVPYDLLSHTARRARKTFWNRRDERIVLPILFGVGWSSNLRSAHRHPLRALLVAAFVLWRARAAWTR